MKTPLAHCRSVWFAEIGSSNLHLPFEARERDTMNSSACGCPLLCVVEGKLLSLETQNILSTSLAQKNMTCLMISTTWKEGSGREREREREGGTAVLQSCLYIMCHVSTRQPESLSNTPECTKPNPGGGCAEGQQLSVAIDRSSKVCLGPVSSGLPIRQATCRMSPASGQPR